MPSESAAVAAHLQQTPYGLYRRGQHVPGYGGQRYLLQSDVRDFFLRIFGVLIASVGFSSFGIY